MKLSVVILVLTTLLLLLGATIAQLTVTNATVTTRFLPQNPLDGHWVASLFTVEFNEEFQFQLDGCASSCCETNISAVLPCCVECDIVGPDDDFNYWYEPHNGSELNAEGCRCQTIPETCIDTHYNETYFAVAYPEPLKYQVFLRGAACNNILIYLEVLSGEHHLMTFLGDNSHDPWYPDNSTRYSNHTLSDGIQYCCDPSSRNYMGDHIEIGVLTLRAGGFKLRVIESTTEYPNFNLDYGTYYSLAPYTVACNNYPPLDSQRDVEILMSIPPAVPDITFNLLRTLGRNSTDFTPVQHPRNFLTFAIVHSEQLWGRRRTLFSGDISSCRVEAGGLPSTTYSSVSASGDRTPFPTSLRVDFVPGYVPCNPSAFRSILDQVNATSKELEQAWTQYQAGPNALSEVAGVSTYLGALLSGDDWFGCYQSVFGLLETEIRSRAVENTIGCYANPGSNEYISDPCCNTSLLYETCCAPREIVVRKQPIYVSIFSINIELQSHPLKQKANTALIKKQCRSSVCTKQLLADAETIIDSLFNGVCTDAKTTANFIQPLANNGEYEDPSLPSQCREQFGLFVPFPCEVDSDCITGTCQADRTCLRPRTFEEAMLLDAQCSLLQQQPLLEAQFRGELNLTSLPQEEYLGAMIQLYSRPVCVNKFTGGNIYGINNESDCYDRSLVRLLEPQGACNWNWGTENDSLCADPYYWLSSDDPLRFGFCGYCHNTLDPHLCQEISQPAVGCWSDCGGRSCTEDNCNIYGGTAIAFICYFPQHSTQERCLPPEFCGSSGTYCSSFCYWNITQQQCENFNATEPFWNDSIQLCTAPSFDTYDCDATGGSWWYGAGWHETGTFASEELCSEYCYSDPDAPIDQCLPTCSEDCFPDCDQRACENLTRCNDDQLQPNGRCYFPYLLSLEGEPYCADEHTEAQLGTSSFKIGCFGPDSMTVDDCARAGGKFLRPATDQESCEAWVGCRQRDFRDFQDYVDPLFPLKTREQCLKCGGDPQNLTTWTSARWEVKVISNLTWATRAPVGNISLWLNTFDSVSYFGGEGSVALFNTETVRDAILSQISVAELLCRFSRVNQMILDVICDCVEKNDGCYSSPNVEPLTVTRFCSNLPSQANITSVSLRTYNSTIYSQTEASPACTNVEIGVISSALFAQRKTTFYSSLFFASIEENEYTIVTNNNSQKIGQLVANGVSVDFRGSFVSRGSVTLCVNTLGAPIQNNFKHPDWALLSGNNTFVAQNVAGMTYNPTTSQICGPVHTTETYFAIMRQRDWERSKYADTLPHDVLVACYVGTALFMFFFLFDIVRIATFIIFALFKGRILATTVLPIIIFTILSFSYTLRWIYFLLVPMETLQHTQEAVNVFIVELPTYLNFTVFLLLVLWWMEMLLFVSNVQKSFLSRMRVPFYALNAIMYTLFIIVLIIIATVPEDITDSCFVSAKVTSKAAEVIGKVYKVLIAVVAFTLAAFAFVYGTRLLVLITGARSKASSATGGNTKRVVMFTAVLLCVSLGLALQCAILLYATFSRGGVNTITALILVLIAELVPTGVLIFAMSPPIRDTGNLIKDIFWCFFPKDTINEGGLGSKSSKKPLRSKLEPKTKDTTG